MKLDKIKFGRLIGMIVHIAQRTLHEDEIDAIDYVCDMPDVEQQPVYPKNDNIERLMMLMAEGTRKIDAIKEHRAITGLGLKESKEAVERYWPDGKQRYTKQQMLNKEAMARLTPEEGNIIQKFIESEFEH